MDLKKINLALCLKNKHLESEMKKLGIVKKERKSVDRKRNAIMA